MFQELLNLKGSFKLITGKIFCNIKENVKLEKLKTCFINSNQNKKKIKFKIKIKKQHLLKISDFNNISYLSIYYL